MSDVLKVVKVKREGLVKTGCMERVVRRANRVGQGERNKESEQERQKKVKTTE